MSAMKLPDPLPLVGRTGELAELEALLESRDDTPGVVFLRGEGGVGKSRVVTELAERAVRRSWQVVKGRAYPAETGMPYALFSDAWLPMLREMDADTLNVLSRGGQAELRHLFPGLAVGSNDDQWHDIGAPDELRTRLMWNFAEFVKRLGGRAPVLCVLEDLQWADESSLHLIHFLARHTRGGRVRFVLTYNDQERDRNPQLIQTERSLDSMSAARVRRLDPLSLDQVGELVSRSFGVNGEVVREFAAVLYGWTRGNAFFVEEIVKSLVETGKLRTEGGSWAGWNAKDFAMPGTIRDAVIGRTRALSQAAQGVAVLAATVGSRVTHGLLGPISELPDAELLTALDELCGHGILDESAESGEVVYHFAHPLVREILYGELGLARARQHHARVAEAMEVYYGPDALQHADELAYHFAYTDAPALRAKAARYLAAAGRRALERRADREAINYLEAALERIAGGAVDGAPALTELVPLLARAYTHVGSFEAAAELWAKALAATPAARPEHTAVRRALGMTYFWLGRHEEAHAHFDAGLDVARASDDESAIVRLLVAKAHCLHELGRGTAALETLKPALPLAEKVGDASLLARVHRALALLHVWIGPPEAAESHARQAIELARAVGDVSIEFWARWGLAVLSGMRGDTDRMVETVAQVDELADRARSPVLRLWTADMVVELRYGQGTWDDGLAYGQQMVALARSLNQRTILTRLLAWTSQFFTARGQHEDAAKLLDEAAEISGLDSEGPHDVHQVVPTYIAMAHHLLGMDRHEEAIEAAEKGRAIAEGTGYTLWAVHQLLPVLAEAYLWVNDVDRAATVGAELRAHSERIDHRLGLAWADACDALIRWRRGDGEGSIPMMRAAAGALEAIPMIWHATRLRRHLSARLRDAGRIGEANVELDRVWKVCCQLGAGPEKERARKDYIAMGLKPPSDPRSNGWRGLTPTELEIAKLIGRGLTSKAAAAERGSSERTVSTHLSNIYEKLDMGGPGARARLAVLVREAGLLDDE